MPRASTSGPPGRSGRSGKPGASGYALSNSRAAFQTLLSWILAAVSQTVGKIQGPVVQAAAVRRICKLSPAAGTLLRSESFANHYRCEADFRLDTTSLELYSASWLKGT